MIKFIIKDLTMVGVIFSLLYFGFAQSGSLALAMALGVSGLSLIIEIIFDMTTSKKLGTLVVDDTGPKIVCRMALDNDPTEYEDGDTVSLVISKRKLSEGIDVNA